MASAPAQNRRRIEELLLLLRGSIFPDLQRRLAVDDVHEPHGLFVPIHGELHRMQWRHACLDEWIRPKHQLQRAEREIGHLQGEKKN